MTRIRRINVSQVEGDGANNNATNEIRPYGEMGVYVGENNKLELLMFDGVRTNLRSKVLAKGTFYGGDADSGDGTGLDTIKLIPDAVLHSNDGDYDNDQYIIIDPTSPNHIHVRAGGAIDASNALLILGGEENNVSVSDSADQVEIRTNDTHTWQFGSDGHITFPDNTIQTTAYPGNNPNVWVQDFETSLGEPADVPTMATSVEYLANGDIVALFTHDVNSTSGTYSGVARFDSYGTKVWSMKFEGTIYTNGWGLAVDNVNGFIYVAGSKEAATGYEVATLTKLSEIDGDVVWSKQYDVGDDNSNLVVDVASDGSPVVVGYAYNGTDNQIVTTKINAGTGSVTWSRALNGQGNEEAYGMAVGPNNEVVSVGYMSQLGVTDGAATLYTVPASNPNWTSPLIAYVGGVNLSVTFTGGVPTFTNVSDTLGNRTVDDELGTISGGGIGGASPADNMTIKVATVAANDTDDRMLIVKYNSAGAIQWQRAVQVEVGYDCTGADADIDSTGNIYVCGNFDYDNGNGGDTESAIIMFKFDSAGVKQWSRKVQGPCEDFAASIVVGSDGYLYLSAVTGNDSNNDYTMVIAKYNTNGTVVWQRLLNNTTSWTFAGGLFFNNNGGSNLAVKDGYVAVSGSFGDPGTTPRAVVAQVTSDGTLFTAGDYDFIAASFSGVLDSAASNITVTDAGKTDSDYIEEFTTSNFSPYTVDLTSDLIGTLYTQGSVNIDSIDNGIYSVGVGADGVVTMTTSRGGLEFGALPEPGGPTHFHIMRPAGESGSGGTDLYFGDDFNYVLQRPASYNDSPAYGVEIGTNDNDGGDQQVWRFGTDGDLTIPGNIKSTTDASIVVGSIYSPVTGVNVQAVDELVPPGGVWRIFISATTYSSLGTTVQVGDTVTTTWGTPVTATIIDVLQLEGTWRFHVAQNIVTGFSAGDTVTFNPVSVTWTFGQDGKLTAPGNLQVDGGKIILNTGGNAYLESVDYGVNSANSAVNIFGGPYQKIKLRAGFGTEATWTFGTDGRLTLPGALVKSTVAKTGVILPTATGVVDGLSSNSVLSGLTDGTYGPFTLTGVTLSVVVFGGVINAFSNVSGTATVNDVLGTVDSGDVGGTAGTTITITVSSVVQATPTALDLTKSVNKLANGNYTLANGVEGQIMYLVRQTGSTAHNVIVASARVDGAIETNISFTPFAPVQEVPTNMATLIFTDSAWQSMGGFWNFT